MQVKTVGEFTLYNGTWFHVPGGYWERRRPATAAEVMFADGEVK